MMKVAMVNARVMAFCVLLILLLILGTSTWVIVKQMATTEGTPVAVSAKSQPTALTAPSQQVGNDNLVEFLILQNESARKNASRITYAFDSDVIARRGQTTTHATIEGNVIEDGNRRWTSRHDRLINGTEIIDNGVIRAVFNGKWFAFWPNVPQQYAYKNELSADGKVQSTTDSYRETFEVQDYLRYSFGDHLHSLRELRSLSGKDAKWIAEGADRDGKQIYLLKRFEPSFGEAPFEIFEIEPEKGFLVTHVRADRTTHGRKWTMFEYSIEAGKVEGTDFYLPKSIKFEDCGGFDSAGEMISKMAVNINFKEYKINPPLPADQFEVSSLQLDTQVKLFSTDALGNVEVIEE